MNNFVCDLRSDTVTQPCEIMRQIMANAPVGDAMFGEDPSVNELEKEVCSYFGFEHGLFVPSGTMSNQIAIGVHTNPGETIISEESSHFYLYESGATSALSGASFETLPDLEGDNFKHKVRPKSPHHSKTSLMIYENTHNEKGGDARDESQTRLAIENADKFNLKKHLDGARIWNAASALSVEENTLTKGFDSASVCFSKGLGAPMGSMLLINGATEFEKAAHLRKRFGGAMRQVGILASGALYAFQNNRQRLKEDFQKRVEMQTFLQSEGFEFKKINRPTNMLYFKHAKYNSEVLHKKLLENGIGCFLLSEDYIRFVFHKDITSESLKACVDKVKLSL